MNDRHLTRIRLDVFLHVTLGGFKQHTDSDSGCAPHMVPTPLRRQIMAAVERNIDRRVPHGTWTLMAERWGWNRDALAVHASIYRRHLKEARHAAA